MHKRTNATTPWTLVTFCSYVISDALLPKWMQYFKGDNAVAQRLQNAFFLCKIGAFLWQIGLD